VRTRERIVEATRRLIDTTTLRDITAINIARESHTSIATFYLYFEDALDAYLAVIDGLSAQLPDFEAEFGQLWHGQRGLAAAKAFVERYLDFFNAHHPVFRVRNLVADEGDPRFFALRIRQATPTLRFLIRQLSKGDPIGDNKARFQRAAATAGMLLAMLERLCATLRQRTFGSLMDPDDEISRSWGRSRLIEASAQILVATVAAFPGGGTLPDPLARSDQG